MGKKLEIFTKNEIIEFDLFKLKYQSLHKDLRWSLINDFNILC